MPRLKAALSLAAAAAAELGGCRWDTLWRSRPRELVFSAMKTSAPAVAVASWASPSL